MTGLVEIILLGSQVATLLVVLYAAVNDVRFLRIPNWTVLAVLGLFAVSVVASGGAGLKVALIGGTVLFVITAVLYVLRVFGGGDAKMIAALGLWLGLADLPAFLMVMSLSGALLAVVALVLKKTGWAGKLVNKWNLKDGWLVALSEGRGVVPYGVAIAVGTVWVFAG